jgi:conserved oligomeric Golgi complex subunit 1
VAESGGRTIAAQILLLQKCRSCVSRLLRDHESSLLAAKVLSVSRLLLKTLTQASSSLPVLDTLRTQLASLRRHLLRRLDQRLSNLNSSREQLVEAICAFCLATSSSSGDALRHYYHLRLQEIRRVLELGGSEHYNVVQALQYYTRSLQTTKALLGRSLSEALRNLGAQSILRDPGVQHLGELDLSTLQRWVAVEIQNFVPFIKYNDPAGPDVDSPTFGWSRDAFESFVEALKIRVEKLQSTTQLLDLRKALLEVWLPVCASTPVHSKSDILDTLREVLNKRMKNLIHNETATLIDIGIAIATTMAENPGEGRPSLSMWDETFVTMPAARGASTFKQQLRLRHFGNSENISRILRSVEAWIERIRATKAVTQQLRRDRWRDLVEEDETDDDAAAETESILQSVDPQLYEGGQDSAVAQAIANFQLSIINTANEMLDEFHPQQIHWTLRVIRETSQRLYQAFPEADLNKLDTVVPSLHSRLALDVAAGLLAVSGPSFSRQHLSQKEGSHLWEGTPPLPVQPSPRVFKLVHKLNEAMANVGADLWTYAAVSALKKTVSQSIAEQDFFDLDAGNLHAKNTDGFPNGTITLNGHNPNPRPSTHSTAIQDLFDVFYLNCALAPKQGDDVVQLTGIVDKLNALSDCQESHAKLVRRRAKDYWARTNLLFGLLA